MMLYYSLNFTDASRAIMFLYTAPFVVAIGGHFLFPAERLDAKAALGILLAFRKLATTSELDVFRAVGLGYGRHSSNHC